MKEVISKEEVEDLYKTGVLKREGTFHAQLDDLKDIILCKLAHMSPKTLGGGKRCEVRDRLLKKTMQAWRTKNQLSHGITGDVIEDVRIFLKDIFIDLVDEKAFDVLPHSNPKKRDFRNHNLKDRADLRQRIKTKYFKDINLYDFDIKHNEEIIQESEQLKHIKNSILAPSYQQQRIDKLITEANQIINEANDKDRVEPNSPMQHILLKQAEDLIKEANDISVEHSLELNVGEQFMQVAINIES